jgi:hypothetical protein
MTRSPEKRTLLEGLGARPVVADALDAAAAQRAVGEARPDAVLNLLTALPPAGPTRAREFRATNEVLQRGTANLIRGARAAGARRMVAESFIGNYGFGTGEVVTEGAPLPRPDPSTGVGAGRAAMHSLEEQVLGAEGIEGIVLRYGAFYGPGVARPRPGSSGSAVGSCRSPAGDPASCRGSTSRTRRRQRWPPSSAAVRARSTTSSTTSRRPSGRSLGRWPTPSGHPRPARSPCGWPGSWRPTPPPTPPGRTCGSPTRRRSVSWSGRRCSRPTERG